MSRHRRPPRGTATAQANGWAPEPRTVAERQPAKGPDSKRMPDVLLAAESPGRHRARARPPGRLQTSSLSDAAFETFQLLTQRPFLVLDCEYTRDPDGDGARLISMAVVPVVRGARSTAQELYVVMNPGVPVDPASTAVHGFTDADVRRKRRFAHYAPAILDALRLPDAVLVTHTGADVRVLRRELERLDEGRGEGVDDPEAPGLAALPDMPIIDTSTLPGQLDYPGMTARRVVSLATLCQLTAVKNPKAHDARGDARATADALVKLLSRAAATGRWPGIQALPDKHDRGTSVPIAASTPGPNATRWRPRSWPGPSSRTRTTPAGCRQRCRTCARPWTRSCTGGSHGLR